MVCRWERENVVRREGGEEVHSNQSFSGYGHKLGKGTLPCTKHLVACFEARSSLSDDGSRKFATGYKIRKLIQSA